MLALQFYKMIRAVINSHKRAREVPCVKTWEIFWTWFRFLCLHTHTPPPPTPAVWYTIFPHYCLHSLLLFSFLPVDTRLRLPWWDAWGATERADAIFHEVVTKGRREIARSVIKPCRTSMDGVGAMTVVPYDRSFDCALFTSYMLIARFVRDCKC